MIDEKEVTAYVTIPDFLFFDRKKRFKKGRLSCYINTAGDDRPKYRVSDKNIDGYKHLGRLVLTLRNYEV